MDRNVIAIVDDLFFASRFAARGRLGVTVRFARNLVCCSKPRVAISLAIICDLHSQRVAPMELANSESSEQSLNPLLGSFLMYRPNFTAG